MKKNLPIIATLSAAVIAGGICVAQTETPEATPATPAVEEAKEQVEEKLTSAKTDTSRAIGTARKWAHDQSDIKPDAKTLGGGFRAIAASCAWWSLET